MYKIQANASGTRTIDIAEDHLQTIKKYALFKNIIDSNGIIDESVWDKLRFNVRAILESDAGKDKALLDLCLDVIYNNNMKALGLHNLALLFIKWNGEEETAEEPEQRQE